MARPTGRPVLDDQLRGEPPVLAIHATPERSARHLDDPDGAIASLLAALDLPEPEPSAPTAGPSRAPRSNAPSLHLGADRIGLCGDGWHGRTRSVEAAWLSGRRLAEAVLA